MAHHEEQKKDYFSNKQDLVQSSSPSSRINRGVSDLAGQGLAYLKNSPSSVARGVVGFGAPTIVTGKQIGRAHV